MLFVLYICLEMAREFLPSWSYWKLDKKNTDVIVEVTDLKQANESEDQSKPEENNKSDQKPEQLSEEKPEQLPNAESAPEQYIPWPVPIVPLHPMERYLYKVPQWMCTNWISSEEAEKRGIPIRKPGLIHDFRPDCPHYCCTGNIVSRRKDA